MKRRSILTALVLLAGMAISTPVRADRPIKASLLNRLRGGRILARNAVSNEPVKPGVAMAIVDAPADLVWKVIMDVDQYRHFVPKMVGSKTLKRGKLFLLRAHMPWPARDNWVYVKVNNGKRGRTRIVAWSMSKGTFKRFEGVAWIQPLGKNRSVLTYQVLALPDVPAPDALWTRGMRTIAKEMVDAIRDRSFDLFTGKVVPEHRVAQN